MFRVKGGPGDFNAKIRQVIDLLRSGDKVTVSVLLGGTRVDQTALGRRTLDRVSEMVEGVGTVKGEAKRNGRRLSLQFWPSSPPPGDAPPTIGVRNPR